MISRNDAFVLDTQKYYALVNPLHLELLQVWYDPNRLEHVANQYGMGIYEYIHMM
jgi:hypothetical protein